MSLSTLDIMTRVLYIVTCFFFKSNELLYRAAVENATTH